MQTIEDFMSVQEATDHFTSRIILAAESAIPRGTERFRRPVPRWSDECQEAVRVRKAALKQLKRHAGDVAGSEGDQACIVDAMRILHQRIDVAVGCVGQGA